MGAFLTMRKINKCGKISFFSENWVELTSFFFLLAGFIISARLGSAFISYLILFVCGTIAGKVWYDYSEDLHYAMIFVILGFVIGYLLGNNYGSKVTLVMLFLAGIFFGYHLFKEGYLKSKVKITNY